MTITQFDLRGTPCPLNFIRTKLKLESMAVGELLEVLLDAGEPIEQVPSSLQLAGYEIVDNTPQEGGHFALTVRR